MVVLRNQNWAASPASSAQTAVHSLIQALNARDYEQIKSFLAPTFETDDTFKLGRTINRQQYLAYLRYLCEETDYAVRVTDCAVDVQPVVRGDFESVNITLKIESAGRALGLAKQAVFLQTWLNVKSGWVCVRQRTVIGVDTFGTI